MAGYIYNYIAYFSTYLYKETNNVSVVYLFLYIKILLISYLCDDSDKIR